MLEAGERRIKKRSHAGLDALQKNNSGVDPERLPFALNAEPRLNGLV
jgi:hypothetical protein